jgi:hypothetical protein
LDYRAKERYTDKTVDRELDEIPNARQYSSELVNKIMSDNVIIIENLNAIKSHKPKRREYEPKVEEMMIKQMEESKMKKHFEKMTSLLNISND